MQDREQLILDVTRNFTKEQECFVNREVIDYIMTEVIGDKEFDDETLYGLIYECLDLVYIADNFNMVTGKIEAKTTSSKKVKEKLGNLKHIDFDELIKNSYIYRYEPEALKTAIRNGNELFDYAQRAYIMNDITEDIKDSAKIWYESIKNLNNKREELKNCDYRNASSIDEEINNLIKDAELDYNVILGERSKVSTKLKNYLDNANIDIKTSSKIKKHTFKDKLRAVLKFKKIGQDRKK